MLLYFGKPDLGLAKKLRYGLVQVHLRVAQGHTVHVYEEGIVVLVQSWRRRRFLALRVGHAEPGLVGGDACFQHEVVHEARAADGAVDQVRLPLGGVGAVLDRPTSCDCRRVHLRP